MTDTSDDWRPFLERWSQEWADAQDPNLPEDERHARDEEPLRTRWLGFPPASEERIRGLEQRLGEGLPPSYRTFLAVTDLSVAENGEERYAFTVRQDTVSRRGPVPAALDPDRLFPRDDPDEARHSERRALDALAAEFGVRLPRFALRHGRLPSLRTRSWRGPLGPGEAWVGPGEAYVTSHVLWEQS
jgi:hypothetical protein